jgi:hypothetical protein
MTRDRVSFSYIQGVSKMFEQTSAASHSHKHIIQTYVRKIVFFFSLDEISHATTNTITIYSKTCLKRNAIVPVFLSVFTGFRFTKGCVLIKQSTKNMIA